MEGFWIKKQIKLVPNQSSKWKNKKCINEKHVTTEMFTGSSWNVRSVRYLALVWGKHRKHLQVFWHDKSFQRNAFSFFENLFYKVLPKLTQDYYSKGCHRLPTLYVFIDYVSIDDIAIYQKNQRRQGNLQCNLYYLPSNENTLCM